MKWFFDFLKKMDKTRWLAVGLTGILLLVIALPTDSVRMHSEEEQWNETLRANQADRTHTENYEKTLADKLEQSLSCMDGVGEVRVMLTFQDRGESVVEKDVTRAENEQGTQYQEAAVYGETDGREPYISQEKLPQVEGVLVIAQGGGDSRVKQDIMDAVRALFPIEAHKVTIVKMQKES